MTTTSLLQANERAFESAFASYVVSVTGASAWLEKSPKVARLSSEVTAPASAFCLSDETNSFPSNSKPSNDSNGVGRARPAYKVGRQFLWRSHSYRVRQYATLAKGV